MGEGTALVDCSSALGFFSGFFLGEISDDDAIKRNSYGVTYLTKSLTRLLASDALIYFLLSIRNGIQIRKIKNLLLWLVAVTTGILFSYNYTQVIQFLGNPRATF